eukprot:jgi/Ulvmu1/12312/UM088_0032.1
MAVSCMTVAALAAALTQHAAARPAPEAGAAAAAEGSVAVVAGVSAALALVLLAAVAAMCAGSKTKDTEPAMSEASTPPKKWQPRERVPLPAGGLVAPAKTAEGAPPPPQVVALEDSGPAYEDSVYVMTVRPMMPSDIGLRTRMDIIGYQLDTFASANKDILREYRSIERPGSRVKGGQATAQIILHPATRREFILKAFAAPTSFHAEAAIYSDEAHPLRRFLPEARAIVRNTDGAFVDVRNTRMPPCIVMLKGVNLQQWLTLPDLSADKICKAVLAIAKRVAELHSLGHVHRDLKPTHALFMPLKADWTIIDFGCACSAGDEQPPAFTLPYAAPEAIEAWYDKEQPMPVSPALDAWSLGIIAVEMLTRKPAFSYSLSMQEVTDQITASFNASLPWEREEIKADILKQLGVLADPIMGLLTRDAAERMSVSDFCSKCAELLGMPAPEIDVKAEVGNVEPREGLAAVSEL